MTDVVVLGDALLDVTVLPSAPIRADADVPARVRMRPGGQGANLAVRLARQGAEVALVCGLADDAAGTLVREALGADRVRVLPIPVPVTGSVVVLLDGAGTRSMLSDRSSLGSAIAAAVPPNADWLVVSGYLLLEPDAPALARSLATHSARRVLVGCTVQDEAATAWRDAVRLLEPDLVILNRAELATLEDAAEHAAGLVVTDATGVTARIGKVTAGASLAPGAPAVDTTGAGDAFASALLASLSGGQWPPSRDALDESLAAGLELASAVARVPGAQGLVASESPEAGR